MRIIKYDFLMVKKMLIEITIRKLKKEYHGDMDKVEKELKEAFRAVALYDFCAEGEYENLREAIKAQ